MVAKIDPVLVVADDKGQPFSIRYEEVNAMLLNEFLKEHMAFVEEQQTVQKLGATVANLMPAVKEQAAEIAKMSVELESSKSALRPVGGESLESPRQ